MKENNLCDSFFFQAEEIPLYQSQYHNMSSFNDFLQVKINVDNIPKSQAKNDVDLISLRSRRDEILQNLKESQENLAKAKQLYPNKIWSNQQNNKIIKLNADIHKELQILEKYKESIKNFKTDIYTKNVKKTDSIINEINNLTLSDLPLIDN